MGKVSLRCLNLLVPTWTPRLDYKAFNYSALVKGGTYKVRQMLISIFKCSFIKQLARVGTNLELNIRYLLCVMPNAFRAIKLHLPVGL